MRLYDPFTFVLITVLTLSGSWELFDVFFTARDRDCHASNSALLQDERHGPLRHCAEQKT